MAFTVQDDEGAIENANAYITVEFFTEYHEDRGNELESELEADIQKAIVKASTYVDSRFKVRGTKLEDDQTTAMPTDYFTGLPLKFKQAVAEYALIALNVENGLSPNPSREASGMRISSIKKKVGPLEKEIAYEAGSYSAFVPYPQADAMMREFVQGIGGFTVYRG